MSEDPFVLNIILEVVKAIIGVAIPALTVYLAFYARKVNENVKRKDLQSKIDSLTSHSLQTKSFESMDYETRVEAIVQSAEAYAYRNDIDFSTPEIQLIVENALTSLKTLEENGLQLYRLKLSKEKNNEKVIDK